MCNFKCMTLKEVVPIHYQLHNANKDDKHKL